MNDRARLARRALHIAVSLAVLYWWFPDRIAELSVTKEQLTVAGLAVMWALEAVRLRRAALIFPMRDYERKRPGAHVFLVTGCAVAVLFFPQRYAMACILGVTLIDPLMGELRCRNLGRVTRVAGFAAWCAQAAVVAVLVPLALPLALILVGAAIAVAVEGRRWGWLDDDFTMNLAPMLALALLGNYIT